MERFNALGRGAQLMLVGAVLLFIDLFLPWQDFDVGGLADELGVDATFSGWRGIGFIVGLLTIVDPRLADRAPGLGGHPAARLDRDDRRLAGHPGSHLHDHQAPHDPRGRGDDLGLGRRRCWRS